MKTIGRVHGLFLVGLTAAVVANCGGKTDGDIPGQTEASGGGTSRGGSSGNLGGSIAVGGDTDSSPSGGATEVTTTVAPRTPATHRPVALSCVGVHSPPEPSDTRAEGNCTRHADCTEGVNGKCIHGIGMARNYYRCVYDQCVTDADCGAGMVCYCTESTAARCLSMISKCQSDADCGGGSYSFCSPSMGFDCSGYHSVEAYYCHTPNDACMDDSDCSGSDYCNFDIYAGRWKCTAPNDNCAIG